MMKLGAILVLLVGLVSADSAPSLNLGLGKAPLQAVVDKVVPPIVQALNGLTFPTLSGSSHVGGIVGDVDYTISSLKLASISTDTPVVSTASGLGIALNNAALTVDAHFEVKESDWPHVSTHGDVTAEISETTIAIAIEIDASSTTGAPILKVNSCIVDIGHIQLKFSDNFFSWLEDLIGDLFEKKIRESIADTLQKELTTKLVMTVNEGLAKLPMDSKLATWAEFQWRLASNSITTADDFTLSLSADITTQNVPITPPGAHHTLPTQGSRMLDLWLDEYLLDSAFWAAQQSGVIDAKVTNGDIFPESSPIGKLINETISKIFDSNPLLKKLLPYESSLLTFQFKTFNAPDIEFTETTDAHFQAPFQISIGAVDNALEVIQIDAPASGSVAVNLLPGGDSGYTVVPSVETLTFTVTNITSVVGPIKDPENLNKIINVVLNEIAVPYLNQMLAKGFALPVLPAGLKLSNPALTFGSGFLHIGADVDVSSSLVTKITNKMLKQKKPAAPVAVLPMFDGKVTADNVGAILANLVTADNVESRLADAAMLGSGDACNADDQAIICSSPVTDGVCQVANSFKADGEACSKKLLDGEAASKECFEGLGLSVPCATAQTQFGVCLSQSSCAFVCGVLHDCKGCDKCLEGSTVRTDCSDPLSAEIGFSMSGGTCQ